jgi:hypothetical protein
MLYSAYWRFLVNYDESAVGGYPHDWQFWYIVLPHFCNEVYNRHGKGYFNTTAFSIPIPAGDNRIVLPQDVLTIETHGAFITGAPLLGNNINWAGYEITPNNDIPAIGAVTEWNEHADYPKPANGYPSTYRIAAALIPELPPGDDSEGDYKVIVLNCPATDGLTLRLKYVQRPPIPAHPLGVWSDTNLSLYIPNQLIPVLALLHRAYIFGDREAGNQDSRFDRQMKRFLGALETLNPIMAASPSGHHMVNSR